MESHSLIKEKQDSAIDQTMVHRLPFVVSASNVVKQVTMQGVNWESHLTFQKEYLWLLWSILGILS